VLAFFTTTISIIFFRAGWQNKPAGLNFMMRS
jgi:hypothetical protein